MGVPPSALSKVWLFWYNHHIFYLWEKHVVRFEAFRRVLSELECRPALGSSLAKFPILSILFVHGDSSLTVPPGFDCETWIWVMCGWVKCFPCSKELYCRFLVRQMKSERQFIQGRRQEEGNSAENTQRVTMPQVSDEPPGPSPTGVPVQAMVPNQTCLPALVGEVIGRRGKSTAPLT